MKNIFLEFIIEPLRNGDWFDKIISLLIITLIVVFVVIIIGFAFYLADSSFLNNKSAIGTVETKRFSPAHSQTTFVIVGKTTVPITTWVPDQYYLIINIDGLSDDLEVSKSFYDLHTKGDLVDCEYTTGRFSKGIYIQSIHEPRP